MRSKDQKKGRGWASCRDRRGLRELNSPLEPNHLVAANNDRRRIDTDKARALIKAQQRRTKLGIQSHVGTPHPSRFRDRPLKQVPCESPTSESTTNREAVHIKRGIRVRPSLNGGVLNAHPATSPSTSIEAR